MKVPKGPPPPPPTPEKDKLITRRTVKGAAGGQLGVDYEDDRRGDAALQVRGQAGRSPGPDHEKNVSPVAQSQGHTKKERDPAHVVLQHDEVAEIETQQKRRRRRVIVRDRMTVEEDAPIPSDSPDSHEWIVEEIRDDDERERRERDEMDNSEGPSRAHLFETPTPEPEPGDPNLLDPDSIVARLKTPAAYAKHVMILAEVFRRATGASRTEGIDYLSRMFLAPAEGSFGRLALKEFGAATGILDIYPLEVLEHILERYPGHLPKAGFGHLFACSSEGTEGVLYTDTHTPLILRYPPELKIRGFALAGGGRPGYAFSPAIDQGQYELRLGSSGRYRLLISAVTASGHTIIDRLRVHVRPRTVADLALLAEPPTPVRNERELAEWPIPAVRPISPDTLLESEGPDTATTSLSERVSQQLLAEARRAQVTRPRQAPEEDKRLFPELRDHLTDEDAALLEEAVAEVIAHVELELED